jgi:NTP pyrophosphatase (non-canonical NTP hydrolase)
MKELSIFDKIRAWALKKGILGGSDSYAQYSKLMEENGELGEALMRRNKEEIVDAIGDMIVVLTSIAHLEGLVIEDCIESAYEVISKRKGKMINGTFVKD